MLAESQRLNEIVLRAKTTKFKLYLRVPHAAQTSDKIPARRPPP